MKNKTKQVWYLYANNVQELKRQCYDIISTLYVQLGQSPEVEIVVQMTNVFTNDLANDYGSMELDEVRFALNKYIRNNDGPHFVNVPMWSQALRDYKKTKALKRQTNQIEEYEIYKKRISSFKNAIDKREIKKIGK
jgi:hypothetical protein|tara:strand:- start:108 stop:515 length:408 start_codon:yes stop_codon:yes gene_type:complete